MKFFNRVRVFTSTEGTGTLTLGSALSDAFLTAAEAGAADADETAFVIEEGDDFEIVKGVIGDSVTTLARAEVLVSKIDGTAGTAKMDLGGTATVRFIETAEALNAILADLANIADVLDGLGDAAFKNTGTGAGDVAAGDHDHAHFTATDNPHSVTKAQVGLGNVTNDAQLKVASNLSDVPNAATARSNLGLGTAATQADTKYAHRANNLSDLGNAQTALNSLFGGGSRTIDAAGMLGLEATNFIVSQTINDTTTGAAANINVDATNFRVRRSTSSIRYKRDIETAELSYSKALIFHSRPVYYRSRSPSDNQEHSFWGFISEEVSRLDPRMVHWGQPDEDGNPLPEGVQYERYVVHLVAVMQEQQRAIEALQERVAALEGGR